MLHPGRRDSDSDRGPVIRRQGGGAAMISDLHAMFRKHFCVSCRLQGLWARQRARRREGSDVRPVPGLREGD